MKTCWHSTLLQDTHQPNEDIGDNVNDVDDYDDDDNNDIIDNDNNNDDVVSRIYQHQAT